LNNLNKKPESSENNNIATTSGDSPSIDTNNNTNNNLNVNATVLDGRQRAGSSGVNSNVSSTEELVTKL